MVKPRILVGMSGGVDSSVAAALLKAEGFDIVGVTLQLYSYEETLEETDEKKQHCHPLSFIEDAKKVAEHLQIPHHVVNHEELFRTKIIAPFLKAYEEGQTPLPCARCNRDVKTSALMELCQSFGAEGLATGHYVRRLGVEEGISTGVQLHQGSDPRRDQSFFLFMLSLSQLDLLQFPLGALSKEETRLKAKNFGLPVAETPASQDLCFIAKKSYKTLFSERPGDIVHENGEVLGTHLGHQRYTVGQRQGLGIGGRAGGGEEALYVVALDAKSNRVTVGPRCSLARSLLTLSEVNWLAHDLQTETCPDKTHGVLVRIRSSQVPIPATVTLKSGLREATVALSSPDYGIAPGQACVFYQGTRVLGGGWII